MCNSKLLRLKALRALLATTTLLLLMAGLLSCGGTGAAPVNGRNALAAVSVVVTPSTMNIATATTQTFTATVNNSNVSGVQWLVNGVPSGNGSIGTIDKSGNFTAPQFIPNPATVTVTAIADADNTKSGSAQATITGAQVPAHVTMSPAGTLYMQVGTSAPLSAAVTGPADTGIIWQVVNKGTVVTDGNSSFGTITPGSNGGATYKAPAALPPGSTVTIRAASHAQPNVFASCTVVISLGPPPFETVIISPVAAALQVQTSHQFNVTIIGTQDQSATWSIVGAATRAGDSAQGTISQTGLYTAPQTVPAPPPPPPPPTPPTPNTITITATSQSQTSASASATVTIVPCPTQFCTAISITPSSVPSLETAGLQTFTAGVFNASSQSVTWYVNGTLNGNSTYGTITPIPDSNPPQANYVAPSTIPALNPVIVSAVPAAAPTLSATAVVIIVPPKIGVTVTPTAPYLEINNALDFQAQVTNTSNQDVNWYANGILGGNSTVGTINNTGSNNTTYTAPAAVPSSNPVTIKAVSVANPGAFGTAKVTITANPLIVLSPPSASVQETLSVIITASTTGLTNPSLLWYVNGEQGGDSTVNGTITPLSGDTLSAQYVAPPTIPSPATVNITAVDQNTGTPSTAAAITVTPFQQTITVDVTPPSATLMPGQQQQFTAVVNATSDQIVNWTLSGPPGGCNATICGTITPQTDGLPATYVAPATIPADPNITITATADASPHPKDTASVTIAILPASISISPANPTVQAGSTSSTTFVAIVENVDPTSTSVSWTLGCISQAPDGFLGPENCGSFLGDGAGPGCLNDGNGHDICSAGSFSDFATVNLSYTPPKILGDNFDQNACTSTAGTNGLVPLTAEFNASNCGVSGVCSATVCITVTPP